MLTHMAQKLSSFFITKGIIDKEDREVYIYSFEVLLATLINLLSVILLAVMTKEIIPTVLFLFGFMCIRTTAGGYHSDTHLGCFLILISSHLVFLVLLKNLSYLQYEIATIIMCLISWLLVVLFSPVEDKNKKFTKKEIVKFKLRSNVTVVIVVLISVLFVSIWGKNKYAFSIATGMCVVSLSLVAGTVKNRLRKQKNNE